MLPITAERPPVVLDNPVAELLLRHANDDLLAPRCPRIVIERCPSLAAREVFNALHYLTMLYQATGRDDFTIDDIARYAKGVSRGRIPQYLRALCEQELVEVVGHREISRLPKNFWPARYRIDLDRLFRLSAAIVVHDLHWENLSPPLRAIKPAKGQLNLDMDVAASTPSSSGDSHHSPGGTVTGAQSSPAPGDDEQAAMIVADQRRSSSQDDGHDHPSMTIAGIQGDLSSQGDGQGHPMTTDITGQKLASPYDDSDDHPTMTVASLQGTTSTLRGSSPSSQDVVGGMCGSMDGGMEGCVGETPARAPNLNHLIQETILKLLPQLGVGTTFAQSDRRQQAHEVIPQAPESEPMVDAGPIATWADLSGRPATLADEAKIKEIIRRFEKPSGGHAAYWLVRALACVAIDDAPLTIAYASGILRRLQLQNDWSSDELHRRAKEQRADTGSESPALTRDGAQTERVPRGKTKPTVTASQATLAPLPAELEGHAVIAAWRKHAGPSIAITPVRVQQLIVQVTDLSAWELVLTNWQAQYKERANWGHFDGLLERYAREVVAARPVQPAPDAPKIPETLIDFHPALENRELRQIWRQRYKDATSKVARQDVLRRLLREHPLTPAQMVALNIPESALA
jgi:hypothetical protein